MGYIKCDEKNQKAKGGRIKDRDVVQKKYSVGSQKTFA